MTIDFPTSLDTLTNPTTADRQSEVSHVDQHSDANDAIEAIESKIGKTDSDVTSSLDYLIKVAEDPGHTHTTASLSGIDISDDTNLAAGNHITLDDDTLNVADDFVLNTGDQIGGETHYTSFDASGSITQVGNANIDTPNSITAGSFTTTGTLDAGITTIDADSTTALKVGSMAALQVDTITDPTHGRVGVGIAPSAQRLEIGYGHLRFNTVSAPTACTGALAGVGGNVDNGDHIYCVCYVTDYGETQNSAKSNTVTVVDKGVDGQVNLTNIPTGPPGVTKRKIYRSKSGDAGWVYLLTTINNNTETTYTDNTADDDLSSTDKMWFDAKENTTAGIFYINDAKSIFTGTSNTGVGFQALYSLASGFSNVALGKQALQQLTSGYGNTSVGSASLQNVTAGITNTAIGSNALNTLSTTHNNTAVGAEALRYITTSYNAAIGEYAGRVMTTGGYNTFLGARAGYIGTTESINYSTLIGYNAQATTSNTLVLGGGTNAASSAGISAIAINGLTDADIAISFYATTNSGLCTWMEDEDYFKFSDDILMDTSEKVNFRDTAVGIYSQADTFLDIFADGGVRIGDSSEGAPSSYTNFNASGHITLPAGTAAANTAPLKFTAGTLLETPEAGTIEYDGDKFYITNGVTQRAIDRTSNVAVETVTCSNTTDETTIWTAIMAANSLDAGNVFMFHANGAVESASNSDLVTLRLKIDGVTRATLVQDTKKMVGAHWHIDAIATQRTIGETGSRAMHAHLEIDEVDAWLSDILEVNTTDTMDITLTAQWNEADVGNILQLFQAFMQYKN